MRIRRSSVKLCGALLALLCTTQSSRALAQPEPPPSASPQPEPTPAPRDPPPPEATPKPDAGAAPAKPAEAASAPSLPVVQMQNTSSGGAPPPAASPPVTASAQPGQPGGPSGVPSTARGAPAPQASDWHFDFHGYLRAPLRIGIGKRDDPLPDQSETTLHIPVVPDDQYLSWQHSGHQQRDWAEIFLSYGNSWVKGTVALLGFNFTDAAFTDKSAQFGIAQGWVTLSSDLGYQNVRFEAKVGSFWNKYGMAGKYDAGKYDTYLFGRTHVIGEAVKIEIDVNKLTLYAEEGFGAKRPNPSVYNNARFTLLHHLHGGASWDKTIDVSVHHLYSWTQEEDRLGSVLVDVPNGSLNVIGADVRFHGTMYGDLYAGYSHIGAQDAITVDSAVEVLHANGGGEFGLGVTHNYLGGPVPTNHGTGSVDSFLFQYEFSLANLLLNLKNPGSRFWGEGRDLTLALFGMINAVSSEDAEMDGVIKLKYGAEVVFNAFPWVGIGARFDRLQPNSKIPEQSFAVLSPRLIFRSQWVSHEEISLQYSRYFYNQRECDDPAAPALCVQAPSAPVLPEGFGATTVNQDPNTRGAPTTRPDLNVLRLQATMWW
jgi:hypothetical protein